MMTQHHFNQAPNNEEKRRNVVAAGLPIQSEILGDSAQLEDLFNTCYQQHEATVRNYLAKHHSGLSVDDIDDVTMIVFGELFRNRRELPAVLSRDADLPKYLFQKAKSRAIDALRKKARTLRDDANGNLPQVSHPPEEVLFRQYCTAIDSLLERYPSRSRRIVVLSYFPSKPSENSMKKDVNPLTPEEIAQECQCSPNAVRMVLYRFRIDVRAILENDPGIQ